MWWDGPFDGVSDCTPRMTELLRYAQGGMIAYGASTLNPWTSYKYSTESYNKTVFSITNFTNPLQIHSVTTQYPHYIAAGGTFMISGCQPTGWNGSYIAQAGTAGRLIKFKPISYNQPPMTVKGRVTITSSQNRSISPARDCVIEFPAGQYSFSSPLPTLGQVVIRGQSKLSTIFIKRFHDGIFFQSDGTLGNGLIIERLAILADPLYRPGYFCYLSGPPGLYQPDNFQLKDLYVSQYGAITGASPPGGGLWQNGIFIDGINRTSPQGIRIGVIENCEIFNCQSTGVYIRNGVGIVMRGGGLFAASGPPEGTGVFVTGGPTDPLTQSTTCHFEGVINNGVLNITESSFCSWIGGQIGSLATDDSSRWRIDTLCGGSVVNNLVNSSVTLA